MESLDDTRSLNIKASVDWNGGESQSTRTQYISVTVEDTHCDSDKGQSITSFGFGIKTKEWVSNKVLIRNVESTKGLTSSIGFLKKQNTEMGGISASSINSDSIKGQETHDSNCWSNFLTD